MVFRMIVSNRMQVGTDPRVWGCCDGLRRSYRQLPIVIGPRAISDDGDYHAT
jgi:hypothetical protein